MLRVLRAFVVRLSCGGAAALGRWPNPRSLRIATRPYVPVGARGTRETPARGIRVHRRSFAFPLAWLVRRGMGMDPMRLSAQGTCQHRRQSWEGREGGGVARAVEFHAAVQAGRNAVARGEFVPQEKVWEAVERELEASKESE